MENSTEFPTFRHDKQTTSYLFIIFRIMACIVHIRINRTSCKVITGFNHKAV